MTREYMLADKLRNRFYIRDAAARVGMSGSARNSGINRKVRKGVRPASAAVREYSPRITPDGEIMVKKQTINPLFVAALAVVTFMMMALVMSFSQVYQTANDVADLERQLSNLKSEETELALRLEEKNDIRTIETIATTKLGMVKEDSLQRRYVSLSEGEHIVISETQETTESTTGGVMLSSLFSTIGKFFDNFR